MDGFVLAIINFLMVFLVLGGLTGVIFGLSKFVRQFRGPVSEPAPKLEIPSSEQAASEQKPVEQKDQTGAHIAAILGAIQEFTGLPPDAFQIDTIEPIEDMLTGGRRKAHIAAIAAAIHEFTSLPMGSFRIVGIRHVGTVNAWKMAGRLELMGLEGD